MQLVKSYQIIGRRFNSKTLDLISCHIFPIVSIVSVRQWQSVSVCRHKVNNVHTIYLINVFKAKVDAKSHETSILLLIHIPPLNFNLEFHWYHCPYDGRQTVSVIRISWQTQKSLSSLSWHQHRLFLEIECCSYPEFELPRKSLREEKNWWKLKKLQPWLCVTWSSGSCEFIWKTYGIIFIHAYLQFSVFLNRECSTNHSNIRSALSSILITDIFISYYSL